MNTVISSKGQVVIPAALRKSLGLHPGKRLRVSRRGRSLILSAEDSSLDQWMKSRCEDSALEAPLAVDRSAVMPPSKVL
jgi:AbrB family looped-hinge helix DNA binding protein